MPIYAGYRERKQCHPHHDTFTVSRPFWHVLTLWPASWPRPRRSGKENRIKKPSLEWRPETKIENHQKVPLDKPMEEKVLESSGNKVKICSPKNKMPQIKGSLQKKKKKVHFQAHPCRRCKDTKERKLKKWQSSSGQPVLGEISSSPSWFHTPSIQFLRTSLNVISQNLSESCDLFFPKWQVNQDYLNCEWQKTQVKMNSAEAKGKLLAHITEISWGHGWLQVQWDPGAQTIKTLWPGRAVSLLATFSGCQPAPAYRLLSFWSPQ